VRIRQRQGRGRGAALTHGRIERRTIQVLPAPEKINFPHAARALGHPERAALRPRRHLHRGRFPRPHRLWTPRHGLAIAVLHRAGHTNIAECLRWASYNFNHPLTPARPHLTLPGPCVWTGPELICPRRCNTRPRVCDLPD
jgi:hypothetical protein